MKILAVQGVVMSWAHVLAAPSPVRLGALFGPVVGLWAQCHAPAPVAHRPQRSAQASRPVFNVACFRFPELTPRPVLVH